MLNQRALRLAMAEADIKQSDLARMIGASKQTVHLAIRNGQASLHVAIKIYVVLKILGSFQHFEDMIDFSDVVEELKPNLEKV